MSEGEKKMSAGEVQVQGEIGLGVEFVKTLEEAGFIEDGSIKDPWACIVAQNEERKRQRVKEGIGEPEVLLTRKIYDFTCQSCGCEFEAFVRAEVEVPCEDENCQGTATREIPCPDSWAPSPERTKRQLKERSLKHGRHNLKRGHSMRQNETQRNTNDEWHSRTRAKKSGSGVIAQHQNDWKEYAEKPPTEFRPLGNPSINDEGRAVYDKKRRKL